MFVQFCSVLKKKMTKKVPVNLREFTVNLREFTVNLREWLFGGK
jgi:hypothetical protein